MLKHFENACWAVAFLGLVWFLSGEAIYGSKRAPVQSPTPHTKQGSEHTDKSNETANGFGYSTIRPYVNLTASYCTSKRPNEESEWRKKFICESKITDAVIAALTVFLALFTFGLLIVGNRQEKTTRRQMRAFVYPDGGSIFNVATPLNPLPGYKPTGAEVVSPLEGPLVKLTIKNTGSTPAFKVAHWARIEFAPHPLVGELPAIDKSGPMPTSAIPPNSFNTKAVIFPTRLTDEQVAALRDGTAAIYVYGEVAYRDAFKRKRTATYRLFHNIRSGAIGISNDLTWADGGNDAT